MKVRSTVAANSNLLQQSTPVLENHVALAEKNSKSASPGATELNVIQPISNDNTRKPSQSPKEGNTLVGELDDKKPVLAAASSTVEDDDTDQPLYIATYSGVDVFESFIGGIPLMRRCSDDWVNSTQILKAAKFPKAQRTRILEREIQTGVHQKIQGGNGRFQGTWVPLHIAKTLAKKHGLTDEIAPILSYVPDPEHPLKRMNKTKNNATPLKRKKTTNSFTGSNKKKLNIQAQNIGMPHQFVSHSHQGTPTNLQFNVTMPPSQPSQQPQQPPPPHGLPQNLGPHGQPPLANGFQTHFVSYVPGSTPSSANTPQFPQFPQNQQQPQQPSAMMNNHVISQQNHQQIPQMQVQQQFQHHQQMMQQQQQLYQKRQQERFQQQQQHLQSQPHITHQHAMQHQLGPPPAPHLPAVQHHSDKQIVSGDPVGSQLTWSSQDVDESMREGDVSMASRDTDYMNEDKSFNYSKKLIEYFSQGIEDNIPDFILNPPADFRIDDPIDSEGHSPLHWAAAMGNLKLVSILIVKHANPLVQNALGLNPLSRLVTFNNCYEKGNFLQILEYLKVSLYQPDKNNRLILHYLCQFSEIKSKLKSIYYYFTIVLSEVKKQNDFCNEQMLKLKKEQSKKANGMKSNDVTIDNEKDNFIKMILNHRDIDGDTPLHLAIRSRNETLIKALIENGADLSLLNAHGETPFNMLQMLNFPIASLISSNVYPENSGSGVHSNLFDDESQTPLISEYNKENNYFLDDLNGNKGKNSSNQASTPFTNGLVDKVSTPGMNNSFGIISPMKKINFDESSIFALNTSAGNEFAIGSKDNSPIKRISKDFGVDVFNDHNLGHLNGAMTPTSGTEPAKQKDVSNDNDAKQADDTAVLNESDVINEDITLPFNKSIIDLHKFKAVYFDQFEKLEQSLGKDFDNWDQQAKEGVELLTKITSDCTLTENHIRNTLSSIFDINSPTDSETLKNILASQMDINYLATELNSKLIETEQGLLEKDELLSKIIERSQAKNIADLVTREEGKSLEEYEKLDKSSKLAGETGSAIESSDRENKAKNSSDAEAEEKLKLIAELSRLQIQRQEKVSELINKLVTHNSSRKMNNYRKLISISCGLKIESIDDLIDGIEKALLG